MRAFLARRGIEYSKKEVSQVLFTVFSFSVVFFLQKWRTTDFSKSTGISYFAFLFILFLILVFFIVSFQKRYGYARGYGVEYENSVGYLLIAIVITFLFQGYVIVILPGLVVLNLHQTRIGHFRMETNERDVGATALMAPVACFLAFVVFLVLYLSTQSFLFSDLMKVVLATALFTLVPTPKNNGLAIFRWSRFIYAAAVIITFLVFFATVVKDLPFLFGVLGGLVVHFLIGVIDLYPRLMLGS